MKPFSAEDSAKTRSLSSHSGFVIGSKILTLDGELPVEFLTPGDRIITRDTGMAVLRGIEAYEADCVMISVMGGALGHNRPDQDTKLPATQQVLLRDWRAVARSGQPQALVRVGELVDGEFVRTLGVEKTRLYKLEFEAGHIVYVDGLELSCEGPQGALKSAA